jgi:hypothetical protein
LVIRWTRKRYYTDFEGHRECKAYEVVACDGSSVVIRDASGELTHIHFEDDLYWIGAHGLVCEYFKRIK